MGEDLFEIQFENGQALYILADKRCIDKAMKDKKRFSLQIEYVANNFSNDILRDLDNIKECKYILHLFCSSMVEGGQEYHMKDISTVPSKYLDKKLAKSIRYSNNAYGISFIKEY